MRRDVERRERALQVVEALEGDGKDDDDGGDPREQRQLLCVYVCGGGVFLLVEGDGF